jgi:putative transposase
MTFYDGESCGEIGKDKHKQIKRLNKEKDRLDAKISQEKKYYKKCKLKRARGKIYKRINNIVKDLHCKTINFLSNYKVILLPEFKVKRMLPGLNKYVRRSMLDLAHYKFKLRLAQKASETSSKIIICNEAYTSKTCTGCGDINDSLGKKKTFTCPSCDLCIDRDINGARNIMLRVLRGGSWDSLN